MSKHFTTSWYEECVDEARAMLATKFNGNRNDDASVLEVAGQLFKARMAQHIDDLAHPARYDSGPPF